MDTNELTSFPISFFVHWNPSLNSITLKIYVLKQYRVYCYYLGPFIVEYRGVKVKSSLSPVNGSEEKVYKVYVLRLDRCVESLVADVALRRQKLDGHLTTISASGKREFKQTNLQKFKRPGKDVEASNWSTYYFGEFRC